MLKIAASTVHALAGQGYVDPDEPEAQVGATKVVGETAFLLLAAMPASRRFPELHRQISELASQLIPHARAEALRVGLCMRPALARDYGLGHICLSAIGFPDPTFDRLYRQSVEAVGAGSVERVPYREMEQRWIDRIWSGSRGKTRDDTRLARLSMLGRSPGALIASREDIYAFTHALFYVTDLGERSAVLPRSIRAILEDAEAALARCLDTEDYDLGGEVLLAWPLLRYRWSSSASFAFRVMARVEDQVGFLPAPTTRLERYRQLEREEDRKRYVLATAYHTAYVMGMLCAMMLRPGCTRAARSWGGAKQTSASNHRHLRDLLRSTSLRGSGNEPHWFTDLDDLPQRESTALSHLLLVVALQRAAKGGEIERLRHILEMAVRLRLVSGPAMREAARVLRSSVLLSNSFVQADCHT